MAVFAARYVVAPVIDWLGSVSRVTVRSGSMKHGGLARAFGGNSYAWRFHAASERAVVRILTIIPCEVGRLGKFGLRGTHSPDTPQPPAL